MPGPAQFYFPVKNPDPAHSSEAPYVHVQYFHGDVLRLTTVVQFIQYPYEDICTAANDAGDPDQIRRDACASGAE